MELVKYIPILRWKWMSITCQLKFATYLYKMGQVSALLGMKMWNLNAKFSLHVLLRISEGGKQEQFC